MAYKVTSTVQKSKSFVRVLKIEIELYADGHLQFKQYEPLAVMETDELIRLLEYMEDQVADPSRLQKHVDLMNQRLRIRGGGGSSSGGNSLFQILNGSLIFYWPSVLILPKLIPERVRTESEGVFEESQSPPLHLLLFLKAHKNR